MRSKVLLRGIEQPFGQAHNPSATRIVATFHGHPSSTQSCRAGTTLPIFRRAFATAIMGIANPKCTGAIVFDDLIA
jgi:hypothetical protein